jgi:hypothetical protein
VVARQLFKRWNARTNPVRSAAATSGTRQARLAASRFLNDRSEVQRAFALADQLGSVNAAATQLGTTQGSVVL